LILYDAISTLAEAVGDGLNTPAIVQMLMPPIMEKWGQMPNDDRAIFPLLECLTSLAQALGLGFAPYAEATFGRCLHIVEATMLGMQRATQAHEAGMDAEFPDLEFVSCALDLLSGLAEGLGGSLEGLVGASNILALLHACMQDVDPEGKLTFLLCTLFRLMLYSAAACCHVPRRSVLNPCFSFLSTAIRVRIAGRPGQELHGAPYASLAQVLAPRGGQPQPSAR
jgi:hypothetical protein